MKILALETSTVTCSVCLLQAPAEKPGNGNPDDPLPTGATAISRFEGGARKQTALVLPMVEQVLEEADLTLRDLDGIAFGHGPGAFTGVRVAVSVAQGLAYSAGLPVYGVSTLASMAQLAWENFHHPHVVTGLDARMGEIYLGAFEQKDGIMRPVIEEQVCDPRALPGLPGNIGQWLGVGSAAIYQEQIAAQYSLHGNWHEDVHPHAETIARLALEGFRQGQQVSAGEALPVYLRNRVAGGAVR